MDTDTAAHGGLTLQINVSAGDLPFCETTVPSLVRAHRRDVQEVVAVIDCCRPSATPFLHAPSRFPQGEFAARVQSLRALSRDWEASGLFDRLVFVESTGASLRALNNKYCGLGTRLTHDHWGHAFSAYFAGWNCSRTRYVAHFDADILLYQDDGYHWVREGIEALRLDTSLLAAAPRIAPPLLSRPSEMVSLDNPCSGWLRSWPLEFTPAGWRSNWTSTRCHLIDLKRLEAHLPLSPKKGNAYHRLCGFLNGLLSPLFRMPIWTAPVPNSGVPRLLSRVARRVAHDFIPPFPLPPEVLLNEHAAQRGARCLYLQSERAWYVHPDAKPPQFLEILPKLLSAIHKGECPERQRGLSGLCLEAWRDHLADAAHS